MSNLSTCTCVIAGCTGTQSRVSCICAGGIVNLNARLESHTIAVEKPIVIDEAACRESNDSLQVVLPGREIIKDITAPVRFLLFS